MVASNRPRVCGATCHNARTAVCRCWCGGLFHGAEAEAARAEFRRTFNVDTVPTTEAEFIERTGQLDLFTGTLRDGEVWRERRAEHVATRDTRKASTRHAPGRPDTDNPQAPTPAGRNQRPGHVATGHARRHL